MEEGLPLPERPGAVTTLGVINIVWGSLTLVCGGCWLAYLMMAPFMEEMTREMSGIENPAMVPYLGVVQLMNLAVSVLLIVSGAGMLGGRAWGRTLCIVTAIAWLATSLLCTGVGAIIRARVGGMASPFWFRETEIPKEMMPFALGFALLFGACVFLLWIAYPIILLIFMYSSRVREYFEKLSRRPLETGGAAGPGA